MTASLASAVELEASEATPVTAYRQDIRQSREERGNARVREHPLDALEPPHPPQRLSKAPPPVCRIAQTAVDAAPCRPDRQRAWVAWRPLNMGQAQGATGVRTHCDQMTVPVWGTPSAGRNTSGSPIGGWTPPPSRGTSGTRVDRGALVLVLIPCASAGAQVAPRRRRSTMMAMRGTRSVKRGACRGRKLRGAEGERERCRAGAGAGGADTGADVADGRVSTRRNSAAGRLEDERLEGAGNSVEDTGGRRVATRAAGPFRHET